MHMKAAAATVARQFSIETTRPKPAEIDAVAAAVPKGTELYITAVPTQTEDELVAAAAHARRAGLEPVIHIAARRLPSVEFLQERLARLRAEADVRRLLVIGGEYRSDRTFRRRAGGDPEGPAARSRHRAHRHRRLSGRAIRSFR